MKLGDKDNEVLKLQQFLNNHGFVISLQGPGSQGQETIYFGTLTFNALRQFQASVGLPSTGFFGPLTLGYVNSH